MTTIKIGILTVSDRASRGEYEDLGGPAIRQYLTDVLDCSWQAEARVISDDQSIIQDALIELCDQAGCCLVVTTGGTGPAKRDVTPEATEAVCEKIMHGFGAHPHTGTDGSSSVNSLWVNQLKGHATAQIYG